MLAARASQGVRSFWAMNVERPRTRTDPRHRLGAAGEALAERWYRRHGYKVVDRNWRCRAGELDLVLRRGQTIVFCEVKTRSSRRFGHPLEALTPAKQARIHRLAMQWLEATRTRRKDIRFDVAAVERGRVEVFESAF